MLSEQSWYFARRQKSWIVIIAIRDGWSDKTVRPSSLIVKMCQQLQVRATKITADETYLQYFQGKRNQLNLYSIARDLKGLIISHLCFNKVSKTKYFPLIYVYILHLITWSFLDCFVFTVIRYTLAGWDLGSTVILQHEEPWFDS